MSFTDALFARIALLPSGWMQNVLMRWDAHGRLTEVSPQASCPPDVTTHPGVLLPGMPNLHSHAFQRGFAGLAEYRGAGDDDFWSWRERMYAVAHRISPEQLEAVATWLYIEMLQAGYTSVCEFHYVHLDRDGYAYANDAEMSLALLRAAQTAGIGFTLLPVLYCQGGFDGRPLGAAQHRFGRSVEELLGMIARLQPQCAAVGAGLGLAPHSLRAVPPRALSEAVSGMRSLDAGAPIHVHIAEQIREVEDCVAWSGQRPVEWLLDQGLVDAHWCLVHATHMNYAETVALASSGAVAGICPTTEANLGDGIFPADAYLAAGGHWGIGSDSHISVSPVEDLRLLEYAQRLLLRRRNVLASAAMPELATRLYTEAVAGGCQASGHPTVGLELGARADFVLLDASHPLLTGFDGASQLAAHLFAVPHGQAIQAVWSGGRVRVEGGRHAAQEAAAVAYAKARRQLFESS